jgi:quinol-cytochrome oxidoreductase complex cytochrome b subunit
MADLKRMVNRFLDDRYDMETARHFVDKQMHKPLPPNTGWPHVFGSVSLMLFVNQVVTGILLLLYYRPTPEEAFKSIQYLHAHVTCGWLFRQLHAWGATMMVVFVTLHMMRTFFMGSFKKPRELTWVVGVLIVMVTITFGFSGYLLPWNQLSYWATTVGTEIAGAVPGIGQAVRTVMLGGSSVGRETLSRFFTVHVVVLPWVLAFLIGLHLLFVRLQNLSTMEPVGEEKPYPPSAGIPFWPVHMAKEGAVMLAVLGILLTLSVLSPWEIGKPANPLETPEGIKPEWYFLPTYQLLKYFSGERAKVFGILVGNIPFLLLFLWPFLDRTKQRHPRRRPVSVAIGLAGLILALGFGTVGYLSETRRTILGRTIEFDVYGRPSIVQQQPEPPASAPASQAQSSG